MLLLSCAVLVDDMVRNRDNETFLLPEELFGKNDISKDIFGCVYIHIHICICRILGLVVGCIVGFVDLL